MRNRIESKKTRSLGKEFQMATVMEVRQLKMRILMFQIVKNSLVQMARKSRKV